MKYLTAEPTDEFIDSPKDPQSRFEKLRPIGKPRTLVPVECHDDDLESLVTESQEPKMTL